MQVLYCLCKFS